MVCYLKSGRLQHLERPLTVRGPPAHYEGRTPCVVLSEKRDHLGLKPVAVVERDGDVLVPGMQVHVSDGAYAGGIRIR